jgi:hypothetical protein
VLAVPEVRRLSLSWQLAVALAEDQGEEPRRKMIRLLGAERALLVEAALFGTPNRLVCLGGGA